MTTLQTNFLVTCIELLQNLNLVRVEHHTLLSDIPKATECLRADLLGLHCANCNTRDIFSGIRIEWWQPGGLSHTLLHAIVLPIDKLHWEKEFPLIKLSSKSSLRFFNWTCFNKELHSAHTLPQSRTLHGKLNCEVYAAFQSHVYSQLLWHYMQEKFWNASVFLPHSVFVNFLVRLVATFMCIYGDHEL
jgi:hypothetical protein